MKSKGAVYTAAAIGLTLSGLIHAQQAVTPWPPGDATQIKSPSRVVHTQLSLSSSSIASINTSLKSDAFVASTTSGTIMNDEKDRRLFFNESDRFSRMFDKQAAEAGDPRRVPMYLLIPFARRTNQSTVAGADTLSMAPQNQPSLVKDVGALVTSLRAGD